MKNTTQRLRALFNPKARRLLPQRPFPPYAFVPNAFPHPTRSPQGHSYGLQDARFGSPPTLAGWCHHSEWLHTIDLFNFGYYWEAHEGLEQWWANSPRGTPLRPLFQGLLRLCAAGVKARQGSHAGIHSHAKHSEHLLRVAYDLLWEDSSRPLGLDLEVLSEEAGQLAMRAHRFRKVVPMPDVAPVLGLFWTLGSE